MKKLIISPRKIEVIDGITHVGEPLFIDLLQDDTLSWNDVSGVRRVPVLNLSIFEADVTQEQLGLIDADDRFFVISEARLQAGDLSVIVPWLQSKGATAQAFEEECQFFNISNPLIAAAAQAISNAL